MRRINLDKPSFRRIVIDDPPKQLPDLETVVKRTTDRIERLMHSDSPGSGENMTAHVNSLVTACNERDTILGYSDRYRLKQLHRALRECSLTCNKLADLIETIKSIPRIGSRGW